MAAYRIPSDVIVEILVCLPVKSLLRFKSVCKDWYTLINSSLFIQLHLNKSLVFNYRHNHTLFYINDDSFCVVDDNYRLLKPIKVYWPKDIISDREFLRTVGSCHGLVCLRVAHGLTYDWKGSCFLICNPSTQTFKFKPNFPFSELKSFTRGELSYGFGYDGKHDDYKIVVTRKIWEDSVRDVYVYSFKADSWKCATHTPAGGSSGSYCQEQYIMSEFANKNNMLYYFVYSPVDDENDNIPNCSIACFDLSTETWKDDLTLLFLLEERCRCMSNLEYWMIVYTYVLVKITVLIIYGS
ncbi:F-box/kelch-repeat protein At3g23880-like [Silene latifolia]|uniref:F-box/kelch-repeat protein At3g23880-like n=1 Tax=Silene latifolia TaxID=37657 RepID=UPI003D777288